MSLDLEFDPYHKWLGIPPQHQPPNSYRLLGLEVFESDRDVIRAAAERQTAHIHKYKIGPQSEHSQRLLNEIARARVCLLDPASKAEYDRVLRLTANRRRPPDVAAPPVAPPPVAPPHIPLAAVPQVPADALPILDASNDLQGIVPVPEPVEFAGRSRKPYRPKSSKKSPPWWPAIAVCIAAAVLAAIAINKLSDQTQKRLNDQTQAPTTYSNPSVKKARDKPARPRRQQQEPPKTKAPAREGKLPIPTGEELDNARRHIDIRGTVTPQRLLQEARRQDATATRYILLQMAIEEAVIERNREVASMAVEELIEQFDVDGDALRKRIPQPLETEVPMPAVPAVPTEKAPAEKVPEAFTKVSLPSGRTIRADDLHLFPRVDVRAALSVNKTNESTVFVFKRDSNRTPEGLFALGSKKEFDGRALVIYPNGRPKVLLSFENHVRNGVLRHWNADGEIVLFAEFKNGNNLGLTCLCEGGQPILVEEWGTSQKPKSYLIEHTSEGATALDFDHANAEQRRQMLDTGDALNKLRAELFKEEHGWKQSFGKWWDTNDQKLWQLQRAIKIATDDKAKAKLEKKLSELTAELDAERSAGVAAVFDNLNLE